VGLRAVPTELQLKCYFHELLAAEIVVAGAAKHLHFSPQRKKISFFKMKVAFYASQIQLHHCSTLAIG
jgi:hypothetical protein